MNCTKIRENGRDFITNKLCLLFIVFKKLKIFVITQPSVVGGKKFSN